MDTRRFRAGAVVVSILATIGAPPAATQASPKAGMVAQASPEVGTLLDRPAHLSIGPVSLARALSELRHRSGVQIAFSDNLLPAMHRSCRCDDVTVREALADLLEGTGLDYLVVETQVLIVPAAPPRSTARVVLPTTLAAATAEPTPRRLDTDAPTRRMLVTRVRSIDGTVVDGRGRGIGGALVVVVGTTLQTTSDGAGRFRVNNAPDGEVTLRVTAIGYRPLTRAVPVGVDDVRLELDVVAINLEELVVTGTAVAVQKREIGNAVATVDAGEFQDFAPARDFTNLLNGKAPGVAIVPGTGTVGGGPRITIRGQGSFSLSDQPLLYVDGVRVNNDVASGPKSQGYGSGIISRLNDFGPDQIESIQVIKGPAAATLYGTEAANGVIQIITKRGDPGRTRYEFTARGGFQWFMDAHDRIEPNYYLDGNGAVAFQDLYAEQEALGNPPFKMGHVQSYQAAISGGGQALSYLLSSTFDHDDGIDRRNELTRYAMRGNFGITPSEKFSANASLGFVRSQTDLANDIGWSFLFNSLLGFPALKDGPSRGFLFVPPEVGGLFQQWQTLNRFTGSLQLQHRPTSWFSHRLIAGLDQTQEQNFDYLPNDPALLNFLSPTQALGMKNSASNAVTYITADYAATATAKLGSRLSLATSVGGQIYRRQTQIISARGERFPAPRVSDLAATAITFGSDNFIKNTTIGSYLQEQLSWNDRAFLTAAVRIDNNSAFGSDIQLVAYPKISASWVVSDEPFWNVDWIDAFRLRGAFGESGQQPQVFAALRSYQAVTIGGGQPGVTPQFLGNPELKPERGQELEVGLEAGLFDSRVGVDLTFYRKKTKDAILQRILAPSLGFPGNQFVNIGALRNSGFELALRFSAINRERTKLDVGLNWARNDNEVLDLGEIGTIVVPTNMDTPAIALRHQVGLPAGSWFGRKVISADLDANGIAQNVLCDAGSPDGMPSGTGVACDQAPDVFLGRSDPRDIGSFMATLTLFRRLTLYGLLDFRLGVYHGDNDRVIRCGIFQTCRDYYEPRSAAEAAEFQSNLSVTSYAVQPASFAKLRELSASLSFPDRWARALGAQAGSITFAGRNLHTWSDWTSLDPETFWITNQFDKSNQTFTPQLAQFITSVRLTF
ncbi:MAG: SusC/RagA family TonB-linked outer membrane protein [Gemmatimonadales bacterium]